MSLSREEKLLKNFGARVAIARKSRKLTQQSLAEITGVSVVAIAYIETGKRWPRIDTLDKIARALKVPISVLLEKIDPSPTYTKRYKIPEEF